MGSEMCIRDRAIAGKRHHRFQSQQIDCPRTLFQPLHLFVEKAVDMSRIYVSECVARSGRVGSLPVLPNPVCDYWSKVQIFGKKQAGDLLWRAVIVQVAGVPTPPVHINPANETDGFGVSFIGLKSQSRFPGLILWPALNPKKVTARRNGNIKGSLGDKMMLLPLVIGKRTRGSPRLTAFVR